MKNKKISLFLSILLIAFPYIFNLIELFTGSTYIGNMEVAIYISKVVTLTFGIYYLNKFYLDL